MTEENVQDVNADSTVINNPNKEEKKVPTIIYGLQALGFFLGITWIAAVVMSYVKKSDYAGTWLESHMKWQIRTFWWGLIWGLVGLVLLFVAGLGLVILIPNTFWLIYRVVKGWLRLNDGKEMYT